jgi:hypothetical protein
VLEIFFLYHFCKKLAAMAREKNRPTSWAGLGAALWIGGEIGGAALGATSSPDATTIYMLAVLGALVGALAAYVIVATLKPLPRDGDLPVARVV